MRKLVAVGLTAAIWLGACATALAHVTVNPREATKGGFAKFDVRVPNERPNAATVKIDIALPEDKVISFVSVAPVPGWKYAITRKHLPDAVDDGEGGKIQDVVSSIAWTAEEGHSIQPGEFMEFPISLGPLPKDADRLIVKANQTYDSSEVVRWIEIAEEGKPEPDHPAPIVTLVEGTDEGGMSASTPAATTGSTSSSNGRATAALVVALIAAALAIAAMTAGRGRSEAAPTKE